MQIKTSLRFHLTPDRIAIIQNITNNKYWRGCGEKRNPNPLLVGMQAGATTLEKNLESSRENKGCTGKEKNYICIATCIYIYRAGETERERERELLYAWF
jgi:hypothetical protein